MKNPQELARRAAIACLLALPFFLFYGRAIADSLIVLIDVAFIAVSWRTRDFAWARQGWVVVAGVIWAIQLVSSVIHGPWHSVAEALVMVRFFLLVAALQCWVLIGPRARQALWFVFVSLAGWTVLQVWQQYLTGTNVNGFARWPDGSLTGPFYKPRAGEILLLVALPGLLPGVLMGLRSNVRLRRIAAVALLVITVATMILIGQRMPNLLLLLGLLLTACIERRFRLPLLGALCAAGLAVAALPIMSPPTWNKLVLHFIAQMSHFAASPYGELYTRAAVMIQAHPLLGIGFEGFKDFCGNPSYFHGLPALGLPDAINGGLQGCNLHPHNFYLQVGTMGGLPALLLFTVLLGLWATQLLRANLLRCGPVPKMLAVTAAVIFWPLASTSSLFTPDTGGWVFLIMGWALAYAESKRVPHAAGARPVSALEG
jgi:O-antigen ligase